MTYASAQALIDRFDVDELAQRATDDAAVTGALFALTVASNDRSSYDADAIAAADAALARVNRITADVNELIDSKLRERYTVPLPQTPGLLIKIGSDLARYELYDDEAPTEVATRYKAGLKLLDQLASGTVSLGLPSADTTSGGGAPEHVAPERVFDRNSLADF